MAIPARGLLLLAGYPGAGKTTFARALCGVIDATHIESDAVRQRLFAVRRYSPPESARVFREVERLARKALAAGAVAVIDATNLSNRDRKRFVALAAEVAAPLVLVWVVAPGPEIRERLSRPREGFSEAHLGVFEAMRGRAQSAHIPAVVVDSRYPLEASLALVRALLEDHGQ